MRRAPPAAGHAALAAKLGHLERIRERIKGANREAFDRLVNGTPVLVASPSLSRA